MSFAEWQQIGVADFDNVRGDAADVSVGIPDGERIQEVLGSENPGVLVFTVDHESGTILFVHPDLKRVQVGVKDRIIVAG